MFLSVIRFFGLGYIGKNNMTKLNEADIDRAITALTEFCSNHSWEVVYSNKNTDYYHNGIITLYRKRKSEILYYCFLHEIGHAWMLNYDEFYEEKYSELLRRPRRYGTLTYKISKVQEEIEAWNIGKLVAAELKLPINVSKFEKHRAECLSSYIRWASGLKGKKHGTESDDVASNNDGVI